MQELKLKPRKYQVEAAEWAYQVKRGVVVLPTGTGKTLVAALWLLKLFREGRARRAVVLEPTRILVEQTARFLRSVAGLDARPVHGEKPYEEKIRCIREARVVVTTPEEAWVLLDSLLEQGFEALVVDECHHTTGKDAYVKVSEALPCEWRLGLSAFIPRSRRKSIEERIGVIREWSWSHPDVAPYVPPWIGEVYEAPLNRDEKLLLEEMERIRDTYSGTLRAVVQNAIRFYVRDGALALKESLSKPTLLAALLEPVKPLVERVRPLHKLPVLERLLEDHEGFAKAIVFVDRVVVAEEIARRLSRYGSLVVKGRRHAGVKAAEELLEKARSPDVKLIVSTSAGEEGLDLPEADLLVIWSNAASPLRFIQRHGRILRARDQRGPPKFVAYIVTPDTPDMDSFVDAVEAAREAGVDVNVDPEVLEALWRRTTRNRILRVLEGRPMPEEWIAEASGMPLDHVRAHLRKLCSRGEVAYFYTPLGKTYCLVGDAPLLAEMYPDYFTPDPEAEGKAKPVPLGRSEYDRAVTGNYPTILEKLTKRLERYGGFSRLLVTVVFKASSGALIMRNRSYSFLIADKALLDLVLRNAFSRTF